MGDYTSPEHAGIRREEHKAHATFTVMNRDDVHASIFDDSDIFGGQFAQIVVYHQDLLGKQVVSLVSTLKDFRQLLGSCHRDLVPSGQPIMVCFGKR